MTTFKITYHRPPLRGFFFTEIIADDETDAILKFMKYFPNYTYYDCTEL